MNVLSCHPLAKEIINQYGDLLRVGSLRIAGEVVSWDVSAKCLPEDRLADFSQVLITALEKHTETKNLMNIAVRDGLIYWLCKSLSINYALAEVLHLAKDKVGKVCSIESWNRGGSSKPAQYDIHVEPGPMLRVGISWAGKDNLVSCDPRTGEKSIEGSISRVETRFALPPTHGFKPEYVVDMELCRSRPYSDKSEGFSTPCEIIHMATPLRRTMYSAVGQDGYRKSCNDAVASEPASLISSVQRPKPVMSMHKLSAWGESDDRGQEAPLARFGERISADKFSCASRSTSASSLSATSRRKGHSFDSFEPTLSLPDMAAFDDFDDDDFEDVPNETHISI